MRARSFNGRASFSIDSQTSARRVVRNKPGAASVMPRASSSVATPARFNAVRSPAIACSAAAPWTCTPRMRNRRAAGNNSTSSSLRTAPETRVPVTTVPNPFMVKTRSMGKRRSAAESLAGTSAAMRASSRRRSSSPAPVRALTATIGALGVSRNDPRRKSSASRRTTSRVSESTVSDLVSTVMPRRTASRRQMSKCSRTSMPPTPASMLRTKRSCPGTSTNPKRSGSLADGGSAGDGNSGHGSSRCAKPISIVMPRRFSSSKRSASMPVNALTSAVLP